MRLLLVDGSSYLYRAFYALPDLRAPNGQPTGAIRGVVEMLKKLRQQYPSEVGACVFDAPGKTFRDDIFPAYKQQRPSMPDDLRAQIEPLHTLVRALGWRVIVQSGVEADDVIGTLAQQFCQQSATHQCLISTGDKDFAQLVTPQIHLINTMSNEALDPAGVQQKFGVAPHQIVDYLALIGDTVDNVPGVDKVGPKTAVKWLAQYGSLEGVMAHAADIGGVVGKNLLAAKDWLPTAQTLVTIRTDCTLEQLPQGQWSALQFQAPALDQLITQYETLGFKSWLKEAASTNGSANVSQRASLVAAALDQTETPVETSSAPPVLPVSDPAGYQTVVTPEALRTLVAALKQAPLTALDTETTGLDPLRAELVGISVCVAAGQAYYIPLQHRGANQEQLALFVVLAELTPWLTDPQYAKVLQNARYDAHVFANYGITLAGVMHDTQLQSYVLASDRRHNLEALAARHLNVTTISYESLCGKGAQQISFADVPIEAASRYAAEDADLTWQLHQKLWSQLQPQTALAAIYQELELPLGAVLLRMERHGVLIDSQLLGRLSHELGLQMLALEQQAATIVGRTFNLNSPKQLAQILFEEQGLPVLKKTPGGAPSTNEEVLERLAQDYPLARCILDYRGAAKLKSTYTDKLPQEVNPQTGRVHTNYAQTVAVTGRLASNEPNLQNIPIRTPTGRKIRAAFIAPPNHVIVSADYSQIELRLMAHLSGDAQLIAAFTAGKDVHAATAAEIFQVALDSVTKDQRRTAKMINFGLIYGMSAFGLASRLGIERSAAASYMEQYFLRYPGAARYMEEVREIAKAQGYVETIFGRRLWLREINSPQAASRQAAERAAINAPMQGAAADLIKRAMLAVDHWLTQSQLKTKLVLQVHDELVLEVANEELQRVQQQLPSLMEGVAQLAVPLIVELGVGANWDEAH